MMKHNLVLGVAVSLLTVLGVEFVAIAYNPPAPEGPVIVQACKGDKNDDCKN
jgi:hypothetical protein